MGFSGRADGAEDFAVEGLFGAAQDFAAGAGFVVGNGCVAELPAALGIPVGEGFADLERAVGDGAEAAPFEAVAEFEHFLDQGLGLGVAAARDGAAELVLDLAAAFVELADQHQDRLHDVERLEAGDGDGAAVVAGEPLVGGGADDRADMAGADEAIDADSAGGGDFRAVEDGLNGGRRQDVVGEDAEIAKTIAGPPA